MKTVLINNLGFKESPTVRDATIAIQVSDEVYEKISDESAPQGILAVVKKPEFGNFTDNDLDNGAFA